MKAMILAAGLGTRMRPLTLEVPKPALPVLNRPLLHWTLAHLARHGIREAIINLHHLPEAIEKAVGSGRRFGLKVRYSLEQEILGTGGGLRRALRLLGDDPFLVVNGDVLFDFDLTALMRRHLASKACATLALRRNPEPRRYTPIVMEAEGRIRAIAAPADTAARAPYMFTGIHMMNADLLERLPAGASDSVRDLYRPLLQEGAYIQGIPVRGLWCDMGHPRSYLEQQIRLLRRGCFDLPRAHALVHPSARVDQTADLRDAIVGPRVVIGARARVRRSILWAGSRVERNARLSNVILAARTRVAANMRLRDVCVVGDEPHALAR
ncbi:MAG: NDP-sugar synthase [Vicinamibacteria bacterium]|jgi:NDP-sugar pyrophosphorylase family protein|nr:NDP-sugar synthase [Vicinamibacteria bacterium]